MVKMSLDPVQVMSGQVKELKVAPSSNGESRGSWEEKEEFDKDHLGLTTKPKTVSLSYRPELQLRLCVSFISNFQIARMQSIAQLMSIKHPSVLLSLFSALLLLPPSLFFRVRCLLCPCAA